MKFERQTRKHFVVIITLPTASQGETWSLKLSKATNIFLEDHCVDLLGIPPWLAASPEAVLVPVK
ncbi:MAG: hypothetical protein NTY19_45850 [Planctomycetota bacterium]|nr:hypothetical protein [Planctomycetota bacterium]